MPYPAVSSTDPSGPDLNESASRDWHESVIKLNSALDALKQKDYRRSADELDAAIKLYPNNGNARILRGWLYRHDGKYGRALDEANQTIKIAPKCARAYHIRCTAHAIMGELPAALTDCNEGLRLDQRNPLLLGSRGLVYHKMGDLDKAIADYALRINPKYARALFGRGKARLVKGDELSGTRDIATAERLKPGVGEEMTRWGVK
jgi:tetratricopeptide (TPR) repeat protein